MTVRQAAPRWQVTASQVRKHYTDQGFEVTITRDEVQRVKFRKKGVDKNWREGRFVSEYEWFDGILILR